MEGVTNINFYTNASKITIAIAQLKAGNTSENLLNEIRQVIYSMYRGKGITKNVSYNIMNSIKL